jgi:hypothetical protein
VLADAQLSNPAVYMELWVDGKKTISYGSTQELRGTLSLPLADIASSTTPMTMPGIS